ncbi:hypothetical protein JXM83_03710 [Candidatus Woesearchaeota archaeon]|nr:hypothetical protein [Candidatus Woesearchaeota archaeon]
MAEHEYEHHEYVDQDEELDIEQEVYNLQTTVDAMLELLIEKKVFSEAEFEKKFDELCESEECECGDDCECGKESEDSESDEEDDEDN